MEETSIFETIDRGFALLQKHPGAKKLFEERIGRSKNVLANWRTKRTKPSIDDTLHFAKVVNAAVRESKKSSERYAKKLSEFASLITA
jgi:hypothetical protein